jgi:starch synthase
LRDEACDVLLCQEYEEGRFDLAVLIGKLLRLQVFATYQGGNLCRTRFERLIRPRSVLAADGLLIGAEVERQRVRASYAVRPERLHPIANPIAIRPTGEASRRARARQELDIGVEEVVVTWVGRIDLWAKGLDVLVDAWERCCQARPDLSLRLLLLGSGPDAAEMGRRITAAAVTNIRWHNEFVLDWTVIWRYYDAADIYAFPSRHEGFAVAPLEAMASGLPVVAASAQGVTDLFGDDDVGLLVPVDDPVAFADALGRLIDDPTARRAMGQRALVNVALRFSVEAIGEQLSSAFLASLAGPERITETAR